MERQGQSWTEQEQIDLEHELKLNMTFDDIARKHKRSNLAIRLRFARLINTHLRNGESKVKIAKIYNTTESMIEKILSENSSNSNNNTSSILSTGMEEKVDKLEKKVEKLEKIVSKLYENYKKTKK